MRWLVAVLILAQAPALAQAPSLLPVGPFRIEPGESRVEFVMRDNRGGFTGTTDRVEGTVVVRQGDGEAFTASVDARVDARTIVTGNGMRDGQMRRDFLKSDQYPGRGMAIGESSSATDPDAPLGTLVFIVRELYRAGVELDPAKPPRWNDANVRNEYAEFPVRFRRL